MRRIVADLGNSRIKWAECGADGRLSKVQALALDASGTWVETMDARPGDRWVVASVNPAAARVLGGVLESVRGVEGFATARQRDSWFRSAADVPLRFGHGLAQPDRTGADRALGVGRAVELMGPETGGVVVSVGSALVVERIVPGGSGLVGRFRRDGGRWLGLSGNPRRNCRKWLWAKPLRPGATPPSRRWRPGYSGGWWGRPESWLPVRRWGFRMGRGRSGRVETRGGLRPGSRDRRRGSCRISCCKHWQGWGLG